jgi:hypothetical protein
MHHARNRDALHELFEGYGTRPSWSDRHVEMVRRCEQLRTFVERQAWTDVSAMWAHRARITESWTE